MAAITVTPSDDYSTASPRNGSAGSAPDGVDFSPDTLYTMFERKDEAMLQSLGGVAGLASWFETDTLRGLHPSQIYAQRVVYGSNALPHTKPVSFCHLVKEALDDVMMRILIAAAAVSILFGMTLKDPHTGEVNRSTGWVEGTAILISVALVVGVTAGNDYTKAKKFEEMAGEEARKMVEVVRGGDKLVVDVKELVAGDLMVVSAGQTLPADAILVDGRDIRVDESAASGETEEVPKHPGSDPFLISGTDVVAGEGTAIVVNVGTCSFSGRLAMSTRGSPADTPLQIKLQWLAQLIGKFGLAASILTFAVLAAKDAYFVYLGEYPFSIASYLNFLLVAITLVVVAIPEGLPLAVTIALAYSMREMMRDQCLVRVLAACETMGGAKAICCDKTGTMTTNRMIVVEGWLAGRWFTAQGSGLLGPLDLGCTPHDVVLLAEALIHNSVCDQLELPTGPAWVGGNKTEHALMEFARRLCPDFRSLRQQVAPQDRRTYPFSSHTKRMVTALRCKGRGLVFAKGAAECVLDDCTAALHPDGPRSLDDADRSALRDAIDAMARDGNRTLAVAYAECEAWEAMPEKQPTCTFTLLAILALQDPLRPEVPGAIAACRRAGITVRMVTGDHVHTAVAVAKRCGLLLPDEADGDGAVMEGREFRLMAAEDPAQLYARLPCLRVLARSSPSDKLVLVAFLMDAGDVVAVTGDGTNDAPALKLADVGFAMRSGTDVATGAADMVLMDDNFATVVRAAEWGRTVNDNIRKFLQFQLTVNVAGVLFTLVGSALSSENEEPLKPVQLLWLNLIMDTLGALGLATESPAPDCLTRSGTGPIPRNAPLINPRMWRFIIAHATFQLGMVLTLTFHAPAWFDIGPCRAGDPVGRTDALGRCAEGEVMQTIIFNVFILMQLFNEWNARKLEHGINPFEGLGRSRLFVVIWVLCVVFQVCAVQFLGQFMATVPLTLWQWGLCIALAALELPVGVVVASLGGCRTAVATPTRKASDAPPFSPPRWRSRALSSMLTRALKRTKSGDALTRDEMAALIHNAPA